MAAIIASIYAAATVAQAARPTPADDPRPAIVDRLLDHAHQAALELVEAHQRFDPDGSRQLGLGYLRGHLLLDLERRDEGRQALADVIADTPVLEPYSRFHLALEYERLGQPEIAAGLVASLLSSDPPPRLVRRALRLFERTLDASGDCQLLRGIAAEGWDEAENRRLELAAARCAARDAETRDSAPRSLLSLLDDDTRDDVALLAAHELVDEGSVTYVDPDSLTADQLLDIGFAHFHHREFQTAVRYLTKALVKIPSSPQVTAERSFDCRYALARSLFWLGRHDDAARAYSALAASTTSAESRAQVLYQEARSIELQGREQWPRAMDCYRRADLAEPGGEWSSVSIRGHARLLWLLGREDDAIAVYQAQLVRRPRSVTRLELFMASSDIVRGRSDRAAPWLTTARRQSGALGQAADYWTGRLAELEGRPQAAIEAYLETLESAPFHPFAVAARRRLAQAPLRAATTATGERLAHSSHSGDWYRAWLLLGDEHDQGTDARQRLLTALATGDARALAYSELALVPVAGWPLWTMAAEGRKDEEMLLRLGRFGEASRLAGRYFPLADADLAFTGSWALGRGDAIRRSLYRTDIMRQRLGERIPAPLVDPRLRRLMYPLGYTETLYRETTRHDVDPYLLAAIIREESHFDPEAFSGASARGLTQFIHPTAQEIAARLEIGELAPRDLHRPEIAIALGAAYLDRLASDLGGALEPMVAAYNAGEPQSLLWRSYCYTDQPEEFLSKVTFRETRNYLSKVLTSYAQYQQLYQEPVDGPSVGRAIEGNAR